MQRPYFESQHADPVTEKELLYAILIAILWNDNATREDASDRAMSMLSDIKNMAGERL